MCQKHGSQINRRSYERNLFTITAYTIFILGQYVYFNIKTT